MATTWTNQRVALTKDLVFGLCVYTEEGWKPLSELDKDQLKLVHRLCDFNPSNPFRDELDAMVQKASSGLAPK